MNSNLDIVNSGSQVDNKLLEQADNYIKKHRLIELFEDLATAVAYRKPENLEDFLIEQLLNKKQQGLNSGIFTEQEVHNVFNLFDLKKEGSISKERCIKAIQTMASSDFQFKQAELEKIPEKVDSYSFLKLCESVLGGFAKKEI
jgi:hypothetical protein